MQQPSSRSVPVWDPFVRVFHWSLVSAYAVEWATAENWDTLHERAGYFMLALLVMRVVWGLVGTRHARFSDFVYGRRTTVKYLRELGAGRPRHYLGHNPLGGWMVLALLLTLSGTVISGILMPQDEGLLEELHEALANISLLLVCVHVAGVAVSSLLHRENLVAAMLTGRKKTEVEHV